VSPVGTIRPVTYLDQLVELKRRLKAPDSHTFFAKLVLSVVNVKWDLMQNKCISF